MRSIIAALATLTFFGACADEPTEPTRGRPSSTATFEDDAVLFVEIADDDTERQRGLMGVESLPADQGMAFVYPSPIEGTFWMKDTLIPLSIAFVAQDGRVIDVLDMEPCETEPCPRYAVDEPYVLAIEANLGWFDEHGVEAGDRAELRTDADG